MSDRLIFDDQRVSLDPWRHQYRVEVMVGIDEFEAVASAPLVKSAAVWAILATRNFPVRIIDTHNGELCNAWL